MSLSEAIVRLRAFNVMYGPFESISAAIEAMEEAQEGEDDGK